eukprot:3053301-Rhodomonas_salina.2
MAGDYYLTRQDCAYVHHSWGELAAWDGSAGGSAMGAAAVFLDEAEGELWAERTHTCRVGGSSSSFQAELVAMWLAVENADPYQPLTVLTDSMNVINALQAWGRREFRKDMNRQLNADVMQALLLAVNARSAPIHVVKVKSHLCVTLNESADAAAGQAAVDDDADLLFPADNLIKCMTFSWRDSDTPDVDIIVAATAAEVGTLWTQTALTLLCSSPSVQDTIAGNFLTSEGLGRHLLAKSKVVRPWTTAEERTWMQLVADVYPHNGYLLRIDKHLTGDCPWCPAATTETSMHIQCVCSKYEENRTAAHHSIAKATLASLKDLRLPGWQLWYETPFRDLPFDFAWSEEDLTGDVHQLDWHPDSVAWHEASGTLYFLEFTRAWDEEDSLQAAEERKAEQYSQAEQAVQ